MLFTCAEYFLQINFISLDALSRNSEQIKLSEFLKRNKNLTFLRNTWCSTGNKPNIIWHWSVTSRHLVRKIFIKTRVTAKDTELLSGAINGQASVAYKSTGRHLEDGPIYFRQKCSAAAPLLHYCIFGLERAKFKVEDAKIGKMVKTFSATYTPQMLQLASREDQNVPQQSPCCQLHFGDWKAKGQGQGRCFGLNSGVFLCSFPFI